MNLNQTSNWGQGHVELKIFFFDLHHPEVNWKPLQFPEIIRTNMHPRAELEYNDHQLVWGHFKFVLQICFMPLDHEIQA